jgi:methylglutaconyl-CoA hydratase
VQAENIILTKKEGIGYIHFESKAQNSLRLKDLISFARLIDKASTDEEIKIVVIKSGGENTFCAGANFNELASLETIQDAKAFFMGFGNLILAIKNCDKIVVGRIQGRAIGGGVGLAAACDYTIASENATFRLSELNIGLGPLVIGPMVERKMSLHALASLALNPREWKTAYWGQDHGLYNEVFKTQQQADQYLDHYLDQMITMSTKAQLAVKRMLWENTGPWDVLLERRAEQSAELLMTPECKAEINNFLNKQA